MKTEARDPSLTYTTQTSKKSGDKPDLVKVEVHSNLSGKFTKLARRFDRAARIKKMLAAEEKKLKEQTREAVDDLFDAGDEVYTRVVETRSLVFKVAKAETRTTKNFDVDGFIQEVSELTGIAIDELEKIRDTYTKIKQSAVAAKVLAPTEKKPLKENTDEQSVYDKIKQAASLIKQHADAFLRSWDAKFVELESMVGDIQ